MPHIQSLSKRQDSTASSTPEADIVAEDTVLRQMSVPSLDIWDILLQKGYKNLRGVLREDNDACIKVIQSGRNPTMRHMHRVRGVSIRVLHEIAGKGKESSFVDVLYTPTEDMKADMFITYRSLSKARCANIPIALGSRLRLLLHLPPVLS